MMDIAFDSTWCPVCSRQILPKRILVPVAPPSPPTPIVPPSSPTQHSKTSTDAPSTRLARGKNGTIRARAGGLVHGTGRVRPNGTIKRSPTKDQSAPSTIKQTDPPKQPIPIRTRTIIDQGPIPLYCSDECRLADLQSSYGASFDYKPDRHTSPTLPPVPHNSLSDLSESDSSSSDSATQDPIQIQPPRPKFQVSTGPTTSTRAYAALASIYDLPPCPPPPLLRSDTNSSNESVPNDYQSGIMMAARRIDAALCPPKPARSSWDSPTAALTTQSAFGANSRLDVIPGWTDGSSDWRASVYNFSAPRDPSKPRSPDDDSRRAYKTFVASSHRSRGVYSTLTDSSIAAPSSTISLPSAPSRSNSEVDHLVNKFSQSLARRSESRANMALHHALSTSPTGSTHSLPTVSASNRRREVPILKPGAEGKLLVPNVKMRRTSSTASSLDGTSTSGSFSHTMTRVRSPLSRQNSDLSVEESEHDTMRSSLAGQERAPEVRSWSYSDLLTYPILQLPPKKEKRIETRVVDGVTMEVEVEVEVIPPRKRLFLFPGKSSMPTPPARF